MFKATKGLIERLFKGNKEDDVIEDVNVGGKFYLRGKIELERKKGDVLSINVTSISGRTKLADVGEAHLPEGCSVIVNDILVAMEIEAT